MAMTSLGQEMWSPLSVNSVVIGCSLPKLSEKSGITRPHRLVSYSPSSSVALSNPVNASNRIPTSVDVGLKFGEDVLEERCSHLLPYSLSTLQKALDPAGVVQPRSKTVRQRRQNLRHLAVAPPRCSYLKTSYGKVNLGLNSEEKTQSAKNVRSETEMPKNTDEQVVNVTTLSDPCHHEETVEWDEYLVNVLSVDTARWVVHHRSTDEETRGRLDNTLNARYGPMEEEYPELVRDDVSDVNVPVDSSLRKSSDRNRPTQHKALVERVKDLTSANDTSDVNDMETALSCLPSVVGMSYQAELSDVVYNATAENVKVVPVSYPPPTTLKDILNPRVQNTIFETSNRFQQELLVGSKPIHQQDKHVIVMDSSTVYRKHIQRKGPQSPQSWFQQEREAPKYQGGDAPAGKPERGGSRWVALPEFVEDTSIAMLPLAVDSSEKPAVRDKPNPATLVEILTEWRSLWQLDMCYDNTTPDNIIRDMADIHVDVKLRAIVTCARVTEYCDQLPEGDSKMTSHVKLLPERLFVALECCLDDSHERVRRAAAIALYILSRPSDKAEEILTLAMDDVNCVDRWTAVRCLAYYGECNWQIVSTIMNQLMTSCDETRRRQATNHLIELSKYSTLVHSLLGEHLNSSSWMDRLIACKLLCHLHGQCSKDLVSKLLLLMWNDWQSEVRETAMEALVYAGYGLAVHDSLLKKIACETNATKRANAISKIGQLGLMTAKMLMVFLKCFDDDNSTVRHTTCIACSQLLIRDERILAKLVTLVKEDPVEKIKTSALQALGLIGITTPIIRNAILWAFRFENDSTVRSEACHTAFKLHLTGDDVISTLQERYLVESSERVKSEIRTALAQLGVSPTEDMPMVVQLKNEVRQLCAGHLVRAQILNNELEQARRDASKRLIKKNSASSAKNVEAISGGKHTKNNNVSGSSSGQSRDRRLMSRLASNQSSTVGVRTKVLPGINDESHTLSVGEISEDVPVTDYRQVNVSVRSGSGSKVTGDSGNDVPVISCRGDNIPVSRDSGNEASVTDGSGDDFLVSDGRGKDIPLRSGSENNISLTDGGGDGIQVTDGMGENVVFVGTIGSGSTYPGSDDSGDDPSSVPAAMQLTYSPCVDGSNVGQVQSCQPTEHFRRDGVDVQNLLHGNDHSNEEPFPIVSPVTESLNAELNTTVIEHNIEYAESQTR